MPSNHVGPVDELGRPLDLDGGFIAGAGGDAVGDDDGRAGGAVSGVVIESSRMDEPDDDDLPPLEEEDKHQYLDLPHLEAVHNTGTRKFFILRNFAIRGRCEIKNTVDGKDTEDYALKF